jgi:hypothetical protein
MCVCACAHVCSPVQPEMRTELPGQHLASSLLPEQNRAEPILPLNPQAPGAEHKPRIYLKRIRCGQCCSVSAMQTQGWALHIQERKAGFWEDFHVPSSVLCAWRFEPISSFIRACGRYSSAL